MGDTFFKTFFLSMFAVIGFVGLLLFLKMEKEAIDTRQQNRWIESRGKTPFPKSWRGKIGEGI